MGDLCPKGSPQALHRSAFSSALAEKQMSPHFLVLPLEQTQPDSALPLLPGRGFLLAPSSGGDREVAGHGSLNGSMCSAPDPPVGPRPLSVRAGHPGLGLGWGWGRMDSPGGPEVTHPAPGAPEGSGLLPKAFFQSPSIPPVLPERL